MTQWTSRITLLVFSLVLGLVLASCGQSSIEIGMVETNLPGNWEASYQTFTGEKTDTFRAEEGQTLAIEYDFQVEKGTLNIEINNPEDQVIWDLQIEADQANTTQIHLTNSGRYSIIIEGQTTGGGWNIDWEIQ